MKYLKMVFYLFCFLVSLPVVMGENDKNKNEIVGRVVNKQGIPLPGVEIRHHYNGTINATTDKNGMFSLTTNNDTNPDCCVAVFSLMGYKQVTKTFQHGTSDTKITLQSGQNIWSPPLCNFASKKSNHLGWDLKVPLPKKVEVKKVPGSPYSEIVQIQIGFKSKSESAHHWLELTTGRSWFYVMPYKTLLSSRIIKEREIKGENYHYEFFDSMGNIYIQDTLERLGMDYRGVDGNGKRWRNIGFRLQTISYENASTEAAEYFDKIIDSLCVDPFRVINGERRRLSGIPDFWK